jgi:hypothetical protein
VLTPILILVALAIAAAPLRERRDAEKPWDVMFDAARILLAMHVGFFAVFGMGEVLTDPGGLVAIGALAAVLSVGIGVVVLALRRPRIATFVFANLLVADAVAFGVGALDRAWDRIGPVPLALAMIILAGTAALSRQRIVPAGWLSVGVAVLLFGRFIGMVNGPWWMAVNGLLLLTGAPLVAGMWLLLVGRHRGQFQQPSTARRPRVA